MMEKPRCDGSMHIRTALGQQLISRETALELCRMVIVDWYGPEEYELQKPLRAEDGDNVWKVSGSRIRAAPPPAIVPGPVRMSISKFDAAIVTFTN